ncbi:Mce family protein [Gordonia araii NBRC 100433]|uniref:Mce family protein n=1 Tax=Gordonia araii NBRC 100433 TaxID=1073574 RepID=G7H2R6_9ACTN|nr:MlaD family protein [Gordonia araii]NNG98533.1 MCE family protein [Gordonia araii NBRC 100433]GAB10141.1 Mce family protein [Gordonia araii NBRC 100433]
MTANKRARAALTVGVAVTLALSGCSRLPGLTVEQIPLPAPGGIGDSIEVRTSFDNALNLPSHAKVKLYGTDVGVVTKIQARDYRAIVTMQVSKDAKLPLNTGAELRQATPLGDVFVALKPPTDGAGALVADGGQLQGDTSAAATVEDLLVTAAATVDGGSLGSLQTIITELSAAVGTTPEDHRDLVGVLRGFTTAIYRLNANAAEVDKSMAVTRSLTAQLSDGRPQLQAAIAKLPAAVNAVNSQMSMILATIDKTNKVTAATNDFLNTNEQNTIEFVESLSVALAGLQDATNTLGPLVDNLHLLLPKWAKSTQSSAASVSARVYYLTPGTGFDAASRFPELKDLDESTKTLQQTLTRILGRLTGTKGCCS